MICWDYKFVEVDENDYEETFSILGDEGWEACVLLGLVDCVVFKRRRR